MVTLDGGRLRYVERHVPCQEKDLGGDLVFLVRYLMTFGLMK